ncbi:nucleotide cyclase [Rhexocercosporidium sp. MPI-PUGE-AT-0058]|nr:nucleotide cyclase [Rhexocercosporidium sp. MPI-PUGE-AT-0058]
MPTLPLSPIHPPADLLTCIFTDIIDSTAMWEVSEPATSLAITIHDTIIRHHLHLYRGYEVKNLGDGFFCVFSNARDALDFCLDAQRALQYAIWPQEIMAFKARLDIENDVDPRLTFRGLTVRMGIHYGKLYSEAVNPVNGRWDFHGIVGCVASRVQRMAGGDEIAVSDAFICALYKGKAGRIERGGDLDDGWRRRILGRYVSEGQFCVRSLGKRDLRGVVGPENITLICLRR